MKKNNQTKMKQWVFSSSFFGLLLFSISANSFGIAFKGLLKTYGQRVHESITSKAMADSDFLAASSDPQHLDKEMSSVIEGVRFNDDPGGFLIKGTEAHEDKGSPVLGFILKFLTLHSLRMTRHRPLT